MFQIRLPLLFGDLLFDVFQHNVINCISVEPVELVQGCIVFGNDAQRKANKGTEHPDEHPLALLDTKNVLTKLLTSQTVSLYLTQAMGPLSSNYVGVFQQQLR